MAHVKRGEQQRPPDPRQIRVLVVDSKQNSRAGTIRLLHECSYQAVGVQTGSEALQLLQGQVQTAGEPGVDIIFKEHEPPSSNAARFLKQLQADAVLRTVPVIVVSSYDSRDVVLKCLSLGASDYWIKPLRVNEIRNLWTRVWWRKVSTVGAQLDTSSDDASQYTKNLEEQEPTSKEGSAPDGDAQLLTNNVGHASGHGSGNGSSGVAGGAQLNVPDASGNGNGSSGNGEKGHVGSNTGMGSGDGVGGPRSNGGNGHGGGSGQLGSGNGASAVANGHGSNDGTGTANHVGSNFGNGNCKGKGSNGNGHGGNHEEYNFGNGAPDRGSNGAGVTTNGNAGYDASTTARPTPQAHHAHHSNPQHQHHGKHRHHGYDALAQQAQRANPHLQQGLFQSPPPRPRMAGSSPEVRPTFASAFATAERYFSGTTNGYGSSNGNGGTSAVAAVPQVDKLSKASSKAPHDQQVPAGFTAWASLHSDPAHGGLTNEVAEVAEALTSLRDSGDSPGDSRAGRGEGSNRPSPTPQNVVKPTTLRLSRGAACDETRMPNTRAGAAAAVAAATAAAEPGASSAAATGKVGEYAAPRNMAAWSDPGRGQPSLGGLGPPPSAATAPGAFSAHFPRGSVQMPAPLIASAQQAQQQHSMGSLPPPPASLMPPQQMAQQGGGMFGQFPPPPFGPMPPPFMQPPMAFPWGDPGQIHPGMGPSGGPPPFPFPFGGGSGQYMPQGSQEMMAVQQMMAVQHNYQQQFMMPFQGMHGGAQGFGPPPAFPSNPWGRSPAGPWGRQGQPQPQQVPQQMPPPTMHAPTAGGGAPTTPLMMPNHSLANITSRGVNLSNAGGAAAGGTSGGVALGGMGSGNLGGNPGGNLTSGGGGGSMAQGGGTNTAAVAGGGTATDAQSKREARQQALYKYKEKRKNLNAANKIRYQARKALAEARPRVKGQFVKVARDGTEVSNGGGVTTAASPDNTCEALAAAAAAVEGEVQKGADLAQPMEQDVYPEDEGQEYDPQEEDLGEEEEERAAQGAPPLGSRRGESVQRMAVDPPTSARPRLQADESESATQSITDPRAVHFHQQQPSGAATVTDNPVSMTAAAAAAIASHGSHGHSHHHKTAMHLSGQKHRRETVRGAANRNGSDSGSNSPGEQTPSGNQALPGGTAAAAQQQQHTRG